MDPIPTPKLTPASRITPAQAHEYFEIPRDRISRWRHRRMIHTYPGNLHRVSDLLDLQLAATAHPRSKIPNV